RPLNKAEEAFRLWTGKWRIRYVSATLQVPITLRGAEKDFRGDGEPRTPREIRLRRSELAPRGWLPTLEHVSAAGGQCARRYEESRQHCQTVMEYCDEEASDTGSGRPGAGGRDLRL